MARFILFKGCQWRVGDGRSINIWDDYWILGHRRIHQLEAQEHKCDNSNKVASFIIQETGSWNINRVKQVLASSTAAEVLKMVLSFGKREDKLNWEHEMSGEFSAQSACRLLKALEKEQGSGESSNSTTRNSFCKKLWRLQIPNKIKIFIWRLCKNNLPTKVKLKQRGVLKKRDVCSAEKMMKMLSMPCSSAMM